MTTPLILLAAGGTGGHLFPAEALGVELIRRGYRVRLATDARALRYSGLFTRDMIDVVPSETMRGRNPISLARTAIMLGYGTLVALQPGAAAEACGGGRLRRLSDRAAADGGAAVGRARASSTTPMPCSAAPTDSSPAASMRSPPRCPACSTAIRRWRERPPPSARRCGRRSSPRPRRTTIAPQPSGPLRLLVVGGSQGARVMSDIVPPADRAAGARAVAPHRADPAGARGRHGAGARGL